MDDPKDVHSETDGTNEPGTARRSVLAAAGMLVGGSVFGTSASGRERRSSFERSAQLDSTMNTVSFVGSGTRATYELSVSGQLAKSTALGGSINSGDTIRNDGTTASGWVGGGTDSYSFTGEITDIDVSDPGAVNIVVSPGSGGGGTGTSGGTVAAPGQVQQSIVETAADGGGVVRLQSGRTYEPDETWALGPGVVLDYNGARVRLSADVDLLHCYPGTEVRNAINDVVSKPYTSTVFTFDGGFDGKYSPSDGTVRISGGRTKGVGQNVEMGTLFKFRSRKNAPVYSIRCEGHDGIDIDRIVEMNTGRSGSDGSWMNSNRVRGAFENYVTGIETRGVNIMQENEFGGWWQTGWKTDRFCRFGGRFRGNWVRAALWDNKYANDVPIVFGPESHSTVIRSSVPYRSTWPDKLPIHDEGHENVVLDSHALVDMFSQHAL